MNDFGQRYLTTTEAAALRRKRVQTLRKERWRGDGPPYIRDGGRILYPLRELERWLADHMVTG